MKKISAQCKKKQLAFILEPAENFSKEGNKNLPSGNKNAICNLNLWLNKKAV